MDIWLQTIPVLLSGLVTTLELAISAGVLAMLIAAGLAVLSTSESRIARGMVESYVLVLRSIPIPVALVLVYFGLGRFVTSLGLSAFMVAAIVLTLIEAAYLTPLYRAALTSIGPRQWQAASSLGFGWAGTIWFVILPQALPSSIPITANMLTSIIKDTSLASLITVPEMTLAASSEISLTFDPVPVYVLLGAAYLVVIVPLVLLSRHLENVVARRYGSRVHVINPGAGGGGGELALAFPTEGTE